MDSVWLKERKREKNVSCSLIYLFYCGVTGVFITKASQEYFRSYNVSFSACEWLEERNTYHN